MFILGDVFAADGPRHTHCEEDDGHENGDDGNQDHKLRAAGVLRCEGANRLLRVHFGAQRALVAALPARQGSDLP